MLLKRVNSVKFIIQTEFTCQKRLTGSKSGVTKSVGNRFHTHTQKRCSFSYINFINFKMQITKINRIALKRIAVKCI